jgi:hypothetical protein
MVDFSKVINMDEVNKIVDSAKATIITAKETIAININDIVDATKTKLTILKKEYLMPAEVDETTSIVVEEEYALYSDDGKDEAIRNMLTKVLKLEVGVKYPVIRKTTINNVMYVKIKTPSDEVYIDEKLLTIIKG